jgi:two-component system response regulator HydG
MQVDLLRVLEEKKITRIGSSQPVDVDFRLISATRRNLEKEISKKNFRADFFYRINVINIHIPPLRKRKEDIPLLLDHFLEKYSQETTKQVDRVKPEVKKLLESYDWPGNVRELENAVERAVVLSKSRTLGIGDFSFLQRLPTEGPGTKTLREMEIAYMVKILNESNWNITKAAGVLGINRVTLHKKIKRYGLKST